jgi:hypothetical protein
VQDASLMLKGSPNGALHVLFSLASQCCAPAVLNFKL